MRTLESIRFGKVNVTASISELVGLIAFGLLVLVYTIHSVVVAFKQRMCYHDKGVNETRACEAICRNCGKNLGFIGTWREKQKQITS